MGPWLGMLLHVAGAASAAASGSSPSLGPGSDAWQRSKPSAHGLSDSAVAAGALRIGRLLPERYCAVLVKDGEIVAESVYANASATKYESDSAGKTLVGLLVGAVQLATGFDLDRPLQQYSV
eukprot:SAG22_NODE_5961_length_925_cov_1.198547_2_plen_121_part_01